MWVYKEWSDCSKSLKFGIQKDILSLQLLSYKKNNKDSINRYSYNPEKLIYHNIYLIIKAINLLIDSKSLNPPTGLLSFFCDYNLCFLHFIGLNIDAETDVEYVVCTQLC